MERTQVADAAKAVERFAEAHAHATLAREKSEALGKIVQRIRDRLAGRDVAGPSPVVSGLETPKAEVVALPWTEGMPRWAPRVERSRRHYRRGCGAGFNRRSGWRDYWR